MISMIQIIGLVLVGALLGLLIGFWIRKRVVEKQYDSIREYSRKIINEAHKKAKAINREAALRAKDTFNQMKVDFEKESKEKREQLQVHENRLLHKEEAMDKKIEQYEQREKKVAKKEKDLELIQEDLSGKQAEFESLLTKQRQELERVAGITAEEAKMMLVGTMEEEAKHEAAKVLRRIETETREAAARKAQEIISLAVKRYSGDYVAEKTVSVVNLPN
jgi:ribonucrease Y